MSKKYKEKSVLQKLYHEKSMSTRDIADEFNIDPATAYYWINKHDIDTRNKSESQGGASFSREQLIKLYKEKGQTTVEIAEDFDIDASNVTRALKKHGIETRDYTGENSPSWCGGDVETECGLCGEKIVKSRSDYNQAEKHFCSDECQYQWLSEEMKGVGRKRISVECTRCGDLFETWPFKAEERRFCSAECRNQSNYNKGKNHPNWVNGSSKHYGPNWKHQREKRLEKDEYECVVCSMTNSKHMEKWDYGLHVHHITPKREYELPDGSIDYERANNVTNLITLCAACHGKWEGVPLRPSNSKID